MFKNIYDLHSTNWNDLTNLSKLEFLNKVENIFVQSSCFKSDDPECFAKEFKFANFQDETNRTRRHATESGPSHPVVFIPQKSETECVPVRRMSSWGFMSFILSVMNAVINVANNINNNLNNNNNNKNENNNNQVNTNIGNSGNMQMAMGMAMGGGGPGRLFNLDNLRNRFWRKLEDENVPVTDSATTETPTTTLVYLENSTTSRSITSKMYSELQMAQLMEKLYKAEVEQKPFKSQDGLRKQVVNLMEEMYLNSQANTGTNDNLSKEGTGTQDDADDNEAGEEKAGIDLIRDDEDVYTTYKRIKKREMEENSKKLKCQAANDLVLKSALTVAAQIDLWVRIPFYSQCEILQKFCEVNIDALNQGSSIGYLSEKLSRRSIELLFEDGTLTEEFYPMALQAVDNGIRKYPCSSIYQCH